MLSLQDDVRYLEDGRHHFLAPLTDIGRGLLQMLVIVIRGNDVNYVRLSSKMTFKPPQIIEV